MYVPFLRKYQIAALLVLQTLIVMFGALVVLPFGITACYSFVSGGLLVIVPHAYFARYIFRYRGALFARRIMKGFYFGEAVKFLMTSAGFSLIFVFIHPLNVAVFMAAFILTQVLLWFTPVILQKYLGIDIHRMQVTHQLARD